MKRMLTFISHQFLPNTRNGGVPHLLHESSVVAFVLIAIGLLGISVFGIPTIIRLHNLTATVYPDVLVDLTNRSRNAAHLPTLNKSVLLEQAAKLKAEDMARDAYFAHISPDGKTPWYWMEKTGYTFSYAGENLAVHYEESGPVHDAWLASPTHRANVLGQYYTEIGIATATGMFEGKEATFVVQMLGTPAVRDVVSTVKNIETSYPIIEKEIPGKIAGSQTEIQNQRTIEVLNETPQFLEMKNTDEAITPLTVTPTSQQYAPWYERVLFNPNSTLSALYVALIVMVLLAMIGLTYREYERHHITHFILGSLAILIAGSCLYIGQSIL